MAPISVSKREYEDLLRIRGEAISEKRHMGEVAGEAFDFGKKLVFLKISFAALAMLILLPAVISVMLNARSEALRPPATVGDTAAPALSVQQRQAEYDKLLADFQRECTRFSAAQSIHNQKIVDEEYSRLATIDDARARAQVDLADAKTAAETTSKAHPDSQLARLTFDHHR